MADERGDDVYEIHKTFQKGSSSVRPRVDGDTWKEMTEEDQQELMKQAKESFDSKITG